MRTGELGYWWRSLGGPPPRRASLPGRLEADVAIVGAGFTGLWTAYYLARANPSLRIVVLEREFAGFGASGRNGGWVMGSFSGPARAYEKNGGRERMLALRHAMFETVNEVERFLAEHHVEADYSKSGRLTVAMNEPQLARVREQVREAHAAGLGEDDIHEVARAQLEPRVRVAGARGAAFTPHVARVHPAKLVVGLAAACTALGVKIFESTRVRELRAREAVTQQGAVRARWVVGATEGYTPTLRGYARALVPINSSMIITEPLSEETWSEIGWSGSELMGDAANAYVYLQRTADGRIAIGGRGRPYRFGSRTDRAGEIPRATIDELRAKLTSMFPATAGAGIDHAWSGVLGVPRDSCVSVNADERSGIAWAGGYVGEGVAASNLAGRTLCELLLGEPGPLAALPWVGRRPRRWEREPLRWCEIHAVYALYRAADRLERRGSRPSLLGRVVDRASGRH
jgi:glycine/D-amino acid oxidase-like deaminating enzyme